MIEATVAESHTHWLLAPPLEGPITGGTLYNRFLVEALRDLGDEVKVIQDPCACESSFLWVDSLYLPEAEPLWQHRRAGLIAHYLPSVFEYRDGLESYELAALRGAALVLCTGRWMQRTVERLCAAETALVEPGVHATEPVLEPGGPTITAVLVGTVTARKGVKPMLEVLRDHPPSAPWRLEILGDVEADPGYTKACRQVAEGLPVRFRGALSPASAVAAIAGSHFLVSAASIESYGMAIAEAQACGVPVLARRGGHVEQLVSRVSSGHLVDDIPTLARAFSAWVEDPRGLAERRRISQSERPRRSWIEVAREFRSLSLSVCARRPGGRSPVGG